MEPGWKRSRDKGVTQKRVEIVDWVPSWAVLHIPGGIKSVMPCYPVIQNDKGPHGMSSIKQDTYSVKRVFSLIPSMNRGAYDAITQKRMGRAVEVLTGTAIANDTVYAYQPAY